MRSDLPHHHAPPDRHPDVIGGLPNVDSSQVTGQLPPTVALFASAGLIRRRCTIAGSYRARPMADRSAEAFGEGNWSGTWAACGKASSAGLLQHPARAGACRRRRVVIGPLRRRGQSDPDLRPDRCPEPIRLGCKSESVLTNILQWPSMYVNQPSSGRVLLYEAVIRVGYAGWDTPQ